MECLETDIKLSWGETLHYNRPILVPTIDAKSIMGLLMLGAAKGTSVTFQVDGNDETAAMEELTDLFGRLDPQLPCLLPRVNCRHRCKE